MARPKKVRSTCSVEGCNAEERSSGLCKLHYQRSRRQARSPKVDANPSQWPTEIISWMAGMLEVRGVFRHKEGRFSIMITLVDPRTPVRVRERLGVGSVSGPYKYWKSPLKKIWQWRVSRKQHVRAVCEAVRPWMSETRQTEIDALLRAITACSVAADPRQGTPPEPTPPRPRDGIESPSSPLA